MTRLLRMRKAASALLLVAVLMAMTTVAATAASSNHSKAKFSASSGIGAVGPGHLLGIPGAFSTTAVDVKSRGEAGIKKITIHTVDEGVLNDAWVGGPGTEVTDCSDKDGGGACLATAMVVEGSAILSLHESTARLTDVVSTLVPVSPEYAFYTYSGKLRGKLWGDFVMTGLTGSVAGDAKLRIRGTATYACFLPDAETPLPDVSFCEGEGTGNLFLPVVLNVVDTGHFSAEPLPGAGAAGDHQLVKIRGKLQVTVDANNLLPVPTLDGAIEITKGQAKYITP